MSDSGSVGARAYVRTVSIATIAPDPTADGSEAVPPRRRPALSPSRAGDFKQCPLLYRFRAIDRIRTPPSRAQLKGTLVHAALEALYGLPAGQREPDRASALVDESWAAMDDATTAVVTDDDRSAFLSEARALVVGYYQLEDPRRFSPQSCEQHIETEIGDGVVLRGFVDRIDVAANGALRVVDYKTGRAPGEVAESKALFQMKFYALVLLRTRGIVPAQLRLLYLADGKILTYAPDRDELERFERTLSAMWKAILVAGATGDFRPKTSRLCNWCEHKSLCPAFGGTPPEYPGWPESPAEDGAVEDGSI